MMMRTASPMTRVLFRGQRVHVKRDDVFHLAGNKMRKLYWFLTQDDAYFRDAHLVSYGGAQSNAMLAIAQVAHAKRVPFTYFSRGLQGGHSNGHDAVRHATDNLSLASALGMRHVPLSREEYRDIVNAQDVSAFTYSLVGEDEREVLIPQGAAFQYAESGVRELAHELNSYCIAHQRDQQTLVSLLEDETCDADATPRRFSVIIPSGTGTTAYYLRQHLAPTIRLFTVPCVGDHNYLKDQFQALYERPSVLGSDAMDAPTRRVMPEILVPERKIRFGQLSLPLLQMHHELLDQTAIKFDLLYASLTWQTLFQADNLARVLDVDTHTGEPRELVYVHTGGTSGNSSMLARYAAKYG